MTQASRPLWYLPKDRCPVSAGKSKGPPKGITHWCREGDATWRPIAELVNAEATTEATTLKGPQ